MTILKGTLHEYRHIFMIVSRSIIFRVRNFPEKKGADKIKTQILGSVTFFPENRAFLR